MSKVLLTTVSIILAHLLLAQSEIPIGTWRTHLSYSTAIGAANTDERVYCATDRGLFYFDKQERVLTKITRIDGLSGVQTSTIGYSQEQDILVLAYLDGQIDLIQDNEITGFGVLKNSDLMGDKGVNHISFEGNLAFLSSQLGMIVMNLDKVEIKEAYTNLGSEGGELPINASAVFNDSLFLATEEGMIGASLNAEINRLDYRNWKRFQIPGVEPIPAMTSIANFDQSIFGWTTSGFYSYSGGIFNKIDLPVNEEVKWLQVSSDRLVLTMQTNIITMDLEGEFEIISDPTIQNPEMATVDNDGSSWIADRVAGLISDFSGSFVSYFPDGPFSNQVFGLGLVDNSLLALPGGYDNNKFPLHNQDGFFQFKEGAWTNYNSSGRERTLPIPEIQDLVDAANVPTGLTYFASFGWGLLQWDGSEFLVIDDSTPGSPLINSNPPGRNIQITSVESDQNGNLWIANYGVSTPLHSLNGNGEWQSYSFSGDRGRFPLDLIAMSNKDIWMRLSPDRGGGILVFNPDSREERFITSSSGNGGLPSNRVNDMEVDKDGQMWIGTDNGVAFFPAPFLVLDHEQLDANLPVFESQFLLRGQKVTSIKVDGGNRKWMGTNDGVWLFEESGEEVVFNFTQENSPLLSNRILTIEITPKTGEVFFGTDDGIVSFRGTASEGTEIHQDVKIFPNPVTPDFQGKVGITGLATGAIVKITDVSGKLVKEILAEGSTATWDALDLSGKRISAGVYIIMSSTQDGKDTFIGKIAVVN